MDGSPATQPGFLLFNYLDSVYLPLILRRSIRVDRCFQEPRQHGSELRSRRVAFRVKDATRLSFDNPGFANLMVSSNLLFTSHS